MVTWEAVNEFLQQNMLDPSQLLMITFARNGYETWKIVVDEQGIPLEDKKGRPIVKTTKVPYES